MLTRRTERGALSEDMGGEKRQIVSFGGGGFSMEAGNTLLDDYVLSLTGKERPRVCFIPTASGDSDQYMVRFYRAFSPERCEPSHLSLFRRDRGAEDLREFLLTQDLIYVGGGSVISMLGAWRAHGIDSILREAWEAGVVLCGLSAGSLCWYSEGVTSFHGEVRRFTRPRPAAVEQLRPLRRRGRAARGLPRAPAARHVPRLRGGRRRGAALPRRADGRGDRLATQGEGLVRRRRRRRDRRDGAADPLPGRGPDPGEEIDLTAVA